MKNKAFFAKRDKWHKWHNTFKKVSDKGIQ